MSALRYVVVGTGPAGRAAVATLTTETAGADVVALDSQDPAAALSAADRTVTTAGGRTVAWDRLLLATGLRLLEPLPGWADLPGVHGVGSAAATASLASTLAHGGSVAVAGGSWHALTAAAKAREHGAGVTWLVPGGRLLERVVPPELAGVVADLCLGHGIDVRLGTGVREVLGSPGLSAVTTTAGDTLPARVLVLDVPRRPADELAGAGGLALDDGIVAGADLRCPGVDGVFAAGAVARVWSPRFGRGLRLEDRGAAERQGRAAARQMLGAVRDVDAEAALPHLSVTLFGTTVEWVGHLDGYDEVVYRFEQDGEDDESLDELSALWLRSGRVDAAATVGRPAADVDLTSLVSSGVARPR
jgi:3-phenylpropionate/trans-cinnamate dioxygenase ferredoxin reductase subunit